MSLKRGGGDTQYFKPLIQIGRNVGIGPMNHITAINGIKIGDGVLTGPQVLISDNSHGTAGYEQLLLPPSKRPLNSKGKVVIEDNVWIGQGSMILAGVTIGQGAIIAANSVVTKSVPPYSVAAGNPAKVIRTVEK